MSKPHAHFFASFVARRFWRRRKAHSTKSADRIAVAGTSLAILTVLLTFSVLTGFKEQLRGKLLAITPLITIEPAVAIPEDYEHDLSVVDQYMRAHFPGTEVTDIFSFPVLVKSEDNFDNIILTRKTGKSTAGNEDTLPDEPQGLVISEHTALKLNVDSGSILDIGLTDGNSVKIRRFPVAGIYSTGIKEYDANVAYISADICHALYPFFGVSARRMGIEGTGFSNDDIAILAETLRSHLNMENFNGNIHGSYYMTTLLDSAVGYFAWLSLIDTNVWVITVLMLLIAAFTLIGALVIKILECIPMVGLFKALGATSGQIKPIFIHGGMSLIVKSLIISNVLALIIIGLQHYYGFLPLNPQEYYLDKVPLAFSAMWFIAVDAGTLVLAAAALLLPAMIINKISPAEVVKFK